jgi:hypothetical protein
VASNSGANLTQAGSFYSFLPCSNSKPLACCRGGSQRVVFRGFTAAVFTGILGGQVGANQKCQAEFPNSYFCTVGDYDSTNPTVGPPTSAGAWIDNERKVSGARETSSCATGAGTWTSNVASNSGANLTQAGSFYSFLPCSNSRPLACCQVL